MIGKTISHYRITEKLGEGGMGVVYKAEDTKLQRTVSLKFLSPSSAGTGDNRKRFLREARAAAVLSHANICTVYEVDEFEGQYFIAMEFVSGRTLKEMIESGPLPVTTAIDLFVQVTAGLQEAHDKGITHRDIKPANIMVTPQGQVKILDFGLAKTAAATQITQNSSLAGTAAYMSPEQARGDEVDSRSDIWSLGAVIYESLAGRRPFRGDHPQAVLYSILNENPESIGNLCDELPEHLVKAVDKALAKDVASRYSTVADFRADLSGDGHPSGPGARRLSWRKPGILFSVLGFFAAAVMAILMISGRDGERPGHDRPLTRQVTFTGTVLQSVLSPDGNFVAFANLREDGRTDILVKDLVSGSEILIRTMAYCLDLKWAPDGTILLYGGEEIDGTTGCFLVPRLGGDVRRILDSPWANVAWSPDGEHLGYVFVDDKQVRIRELASGREDSIPLPADVGEVMNVQWHPGGTFLLVHADDLRRQVFWAVRSDGGGTHVIFEKPFDPTGIIKTPVWSPDGDAVYYLRSSVRGQMVLDLLKAPVDLESLRVDGEPEVVMSGLQLELGQTVGGEYSFSQDEKTFLFTRVTRHSNLFAAAIPENGENRTIDLMPLTTGTTHKGRPRISPDGTQVVLSVTKGQAMNIYLLDLKAALGHPSIPGKGSVPLRQLTYQRTLDDSPAWTPDGQGIVFLSTLGGAGRVWSLRLDGSPAVMLDDIEVSPWADLLEWSPGPAIIYRSGGLDALSLHNPNLGEQGALEANEGGFLFQPVWSRDGSRIALFQNIQMQADSEMGLWVFSADGRSRRKLADGLIWPIGWSADEAWIYAWWSPDLRLKMDGCIARVPVAGGSPEILFDLPPESPGERYGNITISPDGGTLLLMKTESRSDAFLVENFDSLTR